MFSGKTTTLISNITCYADISSNHKALLINHSIDTRNKDHIVSSHSSTYKGLSDKVDIVSSDRLIDIDIDNYQTIGIDEAQFFDDLPEAVNKWLNMSKTIIVSGLDSDVNGDIFGHIHELLHMSDSFKKLKAICKNCLDTSGDIVPAPFTSKKVKDGVRIDVGGDDIYYPTCRKCCNY
jgi:thymidine kinase